MPFLTVFTPAYNRAHTLPRTYESLKAQSCKDFIWLIVDDGSSDHTDQLVKEWMENEKEFEIQYIYKPNGGMHTAHNTAYENIHTELNVCIDSDDKMAPDAVRKIKETWEKIRGDERYGGIIALDSDFNGNIIGKGFPDGMKERNARKARMRAMDTIENLFVGSEEQIGELFRGAYDLVNNGEILKVTVKVSENRTYTESFNTREGAPQISMKEKQEATTVLA